MRFFYPLKDIFITQKFGVKSSLYKTKHPGIDLRAQEDTTVYACADGRVIEVKENPPYDGYGSYLTLEHGDGYFTVYAHLNAVIVKLGDEVRTGQALAMSGGNPQRFGAAPLSFYRKGVFTRAGKSTGPHLHLSIRKGDNSPKFAINPLPLLIPNPQLNMPPFEHDLAFVPPWAETSVNKLRKKIAKKKDKDGRPLEFKQPNAPLDGNRLTVILDALNLLE